MLSIATAFQSRDHLLANSFGPLVKLYLSPVQLLGRGPTLLLHLLIHTFFLKTVFKQTEFSLFPNYPG
jgi:hypothetical protein